MGEHLEFVSNIHFLSDVLHQSLIIHSSLINHDRKRQICTCKLKLLSDTMIKVTGTNDIELLDRNQLSTFHRWGPSI